MAEIKRVLQNNVEQGGWLGRIVEMTDGRKVFLRGRKLDGGGGDGGGGSSSGGSSSGGGGVSQDLQDAYNRAVQGGRFEGSEKDGGSKDKRARDQLNWEKTESGQKWLAENGYSPDGGSGTSHGGVSGVVPIQTTAFKNTAEYKALSDEQRQFIDIAFNTVHVGGEADAQKLANAINSAFKIADPYYKAQLGLAKADIISTIARNTGNFQFAEDAIKRTRDELLEDIAVDSTELTLEEQSQVADIIKQLERDVLDIRDQAAEVGSTFGTGRGSRAETEGNRVRDADDVIESTTRRFNFAQQRLGIRAARGETAAQSELDKLSFNRGIDLRDIIRESERALGSDVAGDIAQSEGINAPVVGGVLGTLEEQKQRSVISDIGGFLELQRAFV